MYNQNVPIGESRIVNGGKSLMVGVMDDNAVEQVSFIGIPEIDSTQSVYLAWMIEGTSMGDVDIFAQGRRCLCVGCSQ